MIRSMDLFGKISLSAWYNFNMPFSVLTLEIPDVLLIEPKVYGDQRGFFMEFFRADQFAQFGITSPFVQDNHSSSIRGTLRGLHYQIRYPQGKLIKVVLGEIFDVAVDLRKSSPTFGKWIGINLSERNHQMMWVPAGFAHGFYVLSERAEIIYKTTDLYAPEWERTLLWSDSHIGIQWPLIDSKPPLLSSKDSQGKLFEEIDLFD